MSRIAYLYCPLCESQRFGEFANAECHRHALYQAVLPPVMRWMRCEDCGHVFTDGYFDAQTTAILFSKSHAFQSVGHEFERQRPVWSRVVETARSLTQGDTWLDVGFGDGALLLTAKELGFDPFGVDVRQPQVEALNALGVTAECVRIEDLKPLHGFSVVSLMDVVEHFAFPRASLRRAADLVAKGGVLIVSCPSYGSPVWEAMQRARSNPYWAEIEHFHNFSRAALVGMLGEVGFHIRQSRISDRYRGCAEVYAQRGPC